MKAWLAIAGTFLAIWVQAAPSVRVETFIVAKLSPSGAYSQRDFAVLWMAFRQQYRVGANGTLVQQDYARTLIRKVDEMGGAAWDWCSLMQRQRRAVENG